jgi:thiol:disulfide interchange protein
MARFMTLAFTSMQPATWTLRKSKLGSRLAALALCLIALGSMAAPLRAQTRPPAHPYTTKHIYSDTADPKTDIEDALKQARREHKRVLLDFGGDWCGDCQVLDIYFHQAPNDELLSRNYVLVHVWIGHVDHNLEYPEKYGVDIHKGVPALAVLNEKGTVIYSQKTGEFEDMRHMDSSSVTSFLEKWKRS